MQILILNRLSALNCTRIPLLSCTKAGGCDVDELIARQQHDLRGTINHPKADWQADDGSATCPCHCQPDGAEPPANECKPEDANNQRVLTGVVDDYAPIGVNIGVVLSGPQGGDLWQGIEHGHADRQADDGQ